MLIVGLLIAFACGFVFAGWVAEKEARKNAVTEFFYRHRRSEHRYKLILRAKVWGDGEPAITLEELPPWGNGGRINVPESVFKREFEEYDPADPTGPARTPPMWMIMESLSGEERAEILGKDRPEV